MASVLPIRPGQRCESVACPCCLISDRASRVPEAHLFRAARRIHPPTMSERSRKVCSVVLIGTITKAAPVTIRDRPTNLRARLTDIRALNACGCLWPWRWSLAASPWRSCLALVPSNWNRSCLALFLPPLLQASAYQTDWPAFRSNLRPILLLAVGAVFFTAAAVALVTKLLVPSLSW